MNPCITCPRDEDYCHATGRDEYCPRWWSWRAQVFLWYADCKARQREMIKKRIELGIDPPEEVTREPL